MRLRHREPEWPPGRTAAYRFRLDDGRMIFASLDIDAAVRPDPRTTAGGPIGAGGQPPSQEYFRRRAYAAGRAPWDIGRPQRAVAEALSAGAFGGAGFAGSVLDLGCGCGDNAIHLALMGLRVTGVDFAPGAIARARERLTETSERLTAPLAGSARFVEGDVLRLAACLDGGEAARFDAVLDCGLFHSIGGDAEQEQYAAEFTRHARPGARLVLVAFSDANPDPWEGIVRTGAGRDLHAPRRTSRERLADVFGEESGWRVDAVADTGLEMITRDGSGAPADVLTAALLLTATRV